MIDLGKRVENDVKQAIAEAAIKQGFDKSEVGFHVGGGGMVGPQVVINPETGEQGIVGFSPTWMIIVSLRSLLLGEEPIASGQPIHNLLPTQAEIKAAVFSLLANVDKVRRDKFNGRGQ